VRIPYAQPSIGAEEVELVLDAVINGWGSNKDKYIDLFQAEFAGFVGSRFAIATSSCTGALHMGMAALEIGPGDEVILADSNWVATLAPIVHLGATPVFADIKSDIWCIDPESVRAAISPRTSAVITTHLYGNVADLRELQSICDLHDLWLIEDAAEGIGSRYEGRHVGSFGDFGVFSFHGSKTMTTGEGGMLVTDSVDLHERVLTLSNHGRTRWETRMFWPERVGYKYKISNLQAALGLAQVRRVGDLIADKQRYLDQYRLALAELGLGSLNPHQDGRENGGWMPTLLLESLPACEVLHRLVERQIDARPVFAPLSQIFPRQDQLKTTRAAEFYRRGLNLPAPLGLDIESTIGAVVSALRSSS
jgi:perosamine synthetase